tara:strand:+ start:1013 stop:1738 length:726 start_codon:yes stop_codon:yes gene_type:complete
MKKYKHKKTGIIVEIGVSNKNYYYAYKECEAIAKWVVEDSLDWEEVKEDVTPWHIESKSPIYITTDGVEMFEKNFTVLYLLSKDLTIPSQNIAVIHNFSKQDKEVADRYLTFTSEKNRFNYIEENTKKPIFVSADGKEIFETKEKIKLFGVWINESDGFHYNYFAKGEMEYTCSEEFPINKNDWMWFVDENKRQEYIDNNSPKYSLNDIENCYPHANVTGNRIKDIPVVATLFSNLKKLGK